MRSLRSLRLRSLPLREHRRLHPLSHLSEAQLSRFQSLWRLTMARGTPLLDDVAAVFFNGGETGMWTLEDARGCVPPLDVVMAEAAAQRAANVVQRGRNMMAHVPPDLAARAQGALAAGLRADLVARVRRRIRDYGHIVRHPLRRNKGDDLDLVGDEEAMTDN